MSVRGSVDQRERLRSRSSASQPIAAALTVCVLSALVAASGVIVTAGGNDQRDFHWGTIEYLRQIFPRIDVVNLYTATGPLYHQVVAAVSAPLDLTQSETQFVASFFAAALAAVVVWFALPITDPVLRWLVVAPLLLSPYFWQSALWMLNDDAGLLFGLIALIAVLRQRESGSGYTQLGIGLLIAAAIATRQSYIWLVVPATCATLVAMPGGSKGGKIAAALRLAGPGVAVLTVLALLWRGFSPPLTQEMNASRLSWVSLSYCFAVGALFFVPVAIAVWDRRPRRPLAAYVLPVAAALPALVFESAATTPPDNSRRGSLIWTLVAHTPTIFGRSPFLAILAFVGALALCLVIVNLDRTTATLTGTGVVALAVAMVAGGRLYQKYFELPIAALALIALVALASAGLVARRWPLWAIAGLQAVLLAGIVAKPVLAAL